MAKRKVSLEEQILTHLWITPTSKADLGVMFGDIQNAMDNLIIHKVIQVNVDCKVSCPVGVGKNKKFLDPVTSTLEEVLAIFKKRKKVKNSFCNYKTYADTDARGSRATWEKAAKLLLASTMGTTSYLAILGLDKKPATLSELKRVYLNLIKKEHPDAGGDARKAEQIINAYQAVKELY